jgi:hypothetical protein
LDKLEENLPADQRRPATTARDESKTSLSVWGPPT